MMMEKNIIIINSIVYLNRINCIKVGLTVKILWEK